ncbi:nucleotidyltransferase family protein [Leucothrix sargassi]|nr:nucleotidyltransferase family protein [Leucothrix sargassi]
MKAMILAAGFGERMRPLTDHTPKPLLAVCGKPLIVWHLERLKHCGFHDIVINVAWKGEQIIETLGNGEQFGLSIQYSDEREEGGLETAGGIIKALPLLGDDPFLVVNGDIWCDYEFSAVSPIAEYDLCQLVLVDNPAHHTSGDFQLGNERVLLDGENKLTFSGIAYYRPEMFKGLAYGKQALLPVFKAAINDGVVSGVKHVGEWQDIGTPERLAALDQQLQESTQAE